MPLLGKSPKLAKPSKAKVLLFGPPGTGKTWGALDFPNAYFIDCEGGANLPHYTAKLEESGALYVGPEDGANDFDVVVNQVKALATEKHDRKTLIIDSISHLYNTSAMNVAAEIEKREGKGKGEEYGRNLKEVQRTWLKPLLQWVDRLDMNVILTAHEKNHYKAGEVIGVTADIVDKVLYHFNLVLHITAHGKQRYMRATKSRLTGFPEGERAPWSYAEFAERYGKDAIESDVDQVELISPANLTTLRGLIAETNTAPGQVTKWLNKAGCADLADLGAEIGTKLITGLTKRKDSAQAA